IPDLVLQAHTSCLNEPILYSKNHRQSENSYSENQEKLEQVLSLLVITQTDEKNKRQELQELKDILDDNFDIEQQELQELKDILISLQKNDNFDNWDKIQIAVNAFAKQNKFVANKCRKNLDFVDKSIIRHYDYHCWKSGINRVKKVKDINKIHLTKINNIYNHKCESIAITFAPKHFQLPQEILNKVENYIVVGQLEAEHEIELDLFIVTRLE
ncbi:54_t:CDS:2, partial [Gigaspora margarita]